MKELDFQRELIKAAKKNSGFGWKLDNKWLAGIPDVVIIMGDVYFLECKAMHYKSLPIGHSIKIDATKIQRRILRQIQSAGGNAGLVTLIQYERIDYIHVTKDIHATHSIWGVDDYTRRKRGEEWPIGKIVDLLI